VFVATINVPGFLPMDDDPPVFETAEEAWAWLADERERAEDEAEYEPEDPDGYEHTETVRYLQYIAGKLDGGKHEHGNPCEDWPTRGDGTGTVYGSTPGYWGDHDLGLAYSVTFDALAVVA
jgi:hypothetical protein